MEHIKVLSLNCRGQTRFSVSKQQQIQDIVKTHHIDILLCQETSLDQDSFNVCEFILTNFTKIINNAHNEFGTSCLVKNSFLIEDIYKDSEGRIIMFNVGDITFVNVYLPSGTDAVSRNKREKMLASTLPNLLINRKCSGIIGVDWNCKINKSDCTNHPEIKMSP